MARLHEEVSGRLEEMALVVSRTLGKEFHAPLEHVVVRFVMSPSVGDEHTRTGKERDAMVFHFMPCNFGCYDYGAGVCRVCGPGDHG
jgi:hypothetical protein